MSNTESITIRADKKLESEDAQAIKDYKIWCIKHDKSIKDALIIIMNKVTQR